MWGKGSHQVQDIILVDVTDAKVINNESEHNVACGMPPQAMSEGAWGIAMWCKELDKLVVRNFAGLGQSIHAPLNADVDIIVNGNVKQVVEVNDGLGEVSEMAPHVLKVLEWCTKVEVFNVNASTLGARGGQDAVEEYFGGGKVGGFGTDVANEIDAVAAHSDTDTMGLLLLRAIGGDNAGIGWFLMFRHAVFGDEEHSVGAFTSWHALVTLGKAAPFIGHALLPLGPVRASGQFDVLSYLAGVGVEGIAM